MRTCQVCGNTTTREETVSEVLNIDGKPVLVENIPALVCERCGDATFSRETTEQIRHLVRESGAPIRTQPLEVYALT